MLPNEVINHMDKDELRNYICKINDVEETHGDMVFARDELIRTLQRAYNDQEYKDQTTIRYNTAMSRLRQIEHIYAEKYDEYMPKPVCDAPADKTFDVECNRGI